MATERDILAEAKERYKIADDTERDLRELWLEDMKFEAGEQWPAQIRRVRETDPTGQRPCLTVNKTQLHVRQVVNDMRQNRPQIKVLPGDGGADIKTAEILSGIVRNIESVSDAEIAYDVAIQPQVVAGLGYFRVLSEQVDPILNYQEPRIAPIWNPLTVRMDPEISHPAGEDAEYALLVQDVRRDVITREYGKSAPIMDYAEASGGDATLRTWYPSVDTVRIAEYFEIVMDEQEFVVTTDGDVYRAEQMVKLIEQGLQVQVHSTPRRKVRQCVWRKLAGAGILEGGTAGKIFPSQYIPIVRVAGLERVIDGRRDLRGLVRDGKDPQRIYNYWTTLNTELIAIAPKAPWIGAAAAFEGYELDWDAANTCNIARLPYNHLDPNGQPVPAPQRAAPVMANSALLGAVSQADSDLMSVLGRYEASLGEQGNETSGRAIIARQRQGDNATFHFVDNLSRSIRHCGRILIDMIPRLYDTARVVRVLGEDGSTQFAQLDPSVQRAMVESEDAAGKIRQIYNLHVGRYDVAVVTGPSYATKRQEAADMMTKLASSDPSLMQKAGDLIVKSFDIPGADKLAERLKAFLPPEVQQIEQAEQTGEQRMAAQVQQMQQAMMAQIQPAMEQMQQALQEAQAADAEKAATIQQLEMQLKDKGAEIEQKMLDIVLRYRSEQDKMRAGLEETKMQQEGSLLVAAVNKPETERQEPSERESAQPQPIIVSLDKAGGDELPGMLAQIIGRMDEQQEQIRALMEYASAPRKKQIKINEYNADGMPVGAEVIESVH